MRKAAPWIVLVVSILWVTASMRRPAPAEGSFNLDEFARLPVMMDGRVQPIDSAGRQALLRIRQTTAVPLEGGRTLQSTEWLLEALIQPHQADERAIFPIRDPDLRRDVDPASGAASGVTYHSFNQLAPKLEDIRKRGEQMGALAAQDRRAAERSLLTLLEALVLYQRIKNSLQPNAVLQLQDPGKPVDYDLAAALASHQSRLPAGAAALKAREHGSPFDDGALTAMMAFLQPYETVARVGVLQFVPPADPAKSREGWQNIGVALRDSVRTGEVRPPVTHLAAMSTAFTQGAPEEFNRQLSEYRQWLADSGLQSELRTSASEVFYNRLQPSIKAAAFYLLAVILCAAFWLTRSTMLYRSALAIGGLALALHTADVVFRTILQGRPPVTSAYSATIFVGWVAVVLGVGVEWARRNGLGIMTASLVAVLTVIAGRGFMPGGDPMEAVRATLNGNLWLAGHVGAVAVGYAATLLAGFLAAAYILLGVCTRWLSPTAGAALDHWVSRLIALAALFTAAGTMAGGFWADRVWGRFWGWDPKENAALLVILWAVVYLLVRRNRLAGERTQMSLAAAGVIVTTMSWLGVNMMGVGLHSYGFIAPQRDWLMLFVAGPMAITGLGLVPLRYWRSRQPHVETPLEYTQVSPAPRPLMAPLGVSCTFAEGSGAAGE